MTYASATLAAGASGFLTAWLVALILRPGLHRGSLWLAGISGALLGALTFGVIAVLDFLTLAIVGGQPSPFRVLALTVLIGGVAVVGTLLSVWVYDSLPLPKSVDELLDSYPTTGPAQVWLIGIGVALLLIYYGLDCVTSGRATIGRTMWRNEVHGLPAVLYGIGWISVGMFVHFHYFWTTRARLRPHSRKAKYVSLVVASLSLTIALLASIGAAPPA